jgi:hypothetical protein
MTSDASNNWWIRERRNTQRECQNMFQKNTIKEPETLSRYGKKNFGLLLM